MAETDEPTAYDLVTMQIEKTRASGAEFVSEKQETYSALGALSNRRYRQKMVTEWKQKQSANPQGVQR